MVSRDEYGKTAKAFNEMSQQLQQAEEIRRNLFANVAHELRTPLTILQGKLEWIQQRGQPVQPESLLPLQDELIRLNRLVDDLHQLSLAEAKKLPLDQKPTDIPQLLSRIIDRIQPDADRKGVEIRLHCDAGIPSISVDSNRITQVFLNLLTNALRYTPPGGSVKIDITEKKEGLQIQVSDTGVGIPPSISLTFSIGFTEPMNPVHAAGAGWVWGLPLPKSSSWLITEPSRWKAPRIRAPLSS